MSNESMGGLDLPDLEAMPGRSVSPDKSGRPSVKQSKTVVCSRFSSRSGFLPSDSQAPDRGEIWYMPGYIE
jgi:hypothetical protein